MGQRCQLCMYVKPPILSARLSNSRWAKCLPALPYQEGCSSGRQPGCARFWLLCLMCWGVLTTSLRGLVSQAEGWNGRRCVATYCLWFSCVFGSLLGFRWFKVCLFSYPGRLSFALFLELGSEWCSTLSNRNLTREARLLWGVILRYTLL